MKKTFRHMAVTAARPRRNRRGRCRLYRVFVVGSAVAVATSAGAQAVAASGAVSQAGASEDSRDSRTLSFAIPAGPLEAALAEYQRVTGLKVVLANPGIGALQSPGVSGVLTPALAMDALLAGTSVHATFARGTATLGLRGVSEFVDVAGQVQKVQSPKYTEPIRDTPQTIVVIPQQVYQEQGSTSLRDVLRNTPGITMSIGEGGSGGTNSGDNVMIRGFSARNDIYVDGVRDPGAVSRDAFNVESVEVAKGPSSVTGGKDTSGGSINLVTKTAELENEGTLRIGVGSADYGRSAIDVNRKLSDTVAFRLNGMWQDTGYAGRDVAKYKSWGIAPSLAIGLGTPTQLTLNYSRLQEDNIPDWGIPTLLPDVAIAQGITVNNLNFSNFYGIASRDYEHTTSDIGTATLSHRFSKTLSLRNLTRYGKNFRDAVITPPRPANPVSGQGPEDPGYNPSVPQLIRTNTKYQHRNDSTAANQTDLTAGFSTGALRHAADFGVEFGYDHQPTYATTDLFTNGRPPVDDLFNPTPYVAYTPAIARTGATSDAHATTVAGYAFDTVKFGDHWQADLGVRWDHVVVDYSTVSAFTATAPAGVAATFGRTDAALTGRGALVYKPVERASVYAAYSTGFAPSFDGTTGLTLAATGVNSQALPPERTHNIEVGTKWDLRKDLQLTAAVFDIEKTNAKTTDENGATVLAGDQDVKGVEFGLSGNLTPRWGGFAGLSLMNGTVKASDVSYEVGQQLAYVPHVSLNLWSTYRLSNGLMLGGGANYEDGHYFNQSGGFLFVGGGTLPQTRYVANAAAVQALTKYLVFNAVASYQLNKHLQLQVNGKNLGNDRYADLAYDRHFLPGPTRQVLVTPIISW